MTTPLLLLAVLLVVPQLASAAFSGFLNDVPGGVGPGTPGVDPLFECQWRFFAYDHAKALVPRKGLFLEVFDALRLQQCNATRPPPPPPAPPPATPIPPASTVLYVDYDHGDDHNPGTLDQPLKTIAAAVRQRASIPHAAAIVLRQGIHVLAETVVLNAQHANTVIQNYPNEQVIVTGAQPLGIKAWAPYQINSSSDCQQGMCVFSASNDIYGQVPSPTIFNMTRTDTAQQCADLCQANASCLTFTWHDDTWPIEWNRTCWFRTDVHKWQPVAEHDHVSGCKQPSIPGCLSPFVRNVFVTDLSGQGLGQITGLQIINANPSDYQLRRAIFARHPNSDPEVEPSFISDAVSWLPPKTKGCDSTVIHQGNLPDKYPGMFEDYYLGVGGSCDMFEVDNSSYWCQPNGRTGGTTYCARHPSGVVFSPDDFGNVNMSFTSLDSAQAVVWRGDGEWFTWTFEITGYDAKSNTLTFGRGGFQGSEGSDHGGRWVLEGILELLDSANEFYYDTQAAKLYYFANTTTGTPPPATDMFYAPKLAELIVVRGDQQSPVTNVTFAGITFTGTSRTDLAPHGIPSPGDWGLEPLGALHLEGTVGVTVVNCTFTRVDGNAIMIRNFNRNLSILHGDFTYVGNSAIAQWGSTNYSDGTTGDQPIGTTVAGNVVYELGLYQKQSSGYFQALSCLNSIHHNVMFNMGRAAVNFNDGFGGGTEYAWNLLFNTCRESSDHSSMNSWGRDATVTTFRYGPDHPSVEAIPNDVHHNFHVSNYGSDGGGVDNDDGSSFYQIHDNFFVYGGHKSDFDGHGKVSFNNYHVYTRVYQIVCLNLQNMPHPSADRHLNEGYWNNTCILPGAGPTYFSIGGCSAAVAKNSSAFSVTMGDNRIYALNKTVTIDCSGVSNFDQWLATGADPNTQLFDAPTAADIIEWGRELLSPVPWP